MSPVKKKEKKPAESAGKEVSAKPQKSSEKTGKADSYTPPALLPGRNDPCHCGSGNKYKKCCLAKDDAVRTEAAAHVASGLLAQAHQANKEDKSTFKHPKRGSHHGQSPVKTSTPRNMFSRKIGEG